MNLQCFLNKDIKLNIKIIQDTIDNPPAVLYKINNEEYTISINETTLNMFPEYKSILEKGFLLHEIAHIRYNSIDENKGDQIWSYIENVLEDSRIEYNFSLEFPEAINYFRVTLKLMKDVMKITNDNRTANISLDNMLDLDEEPKLKDEEVKFNEDMEAFYFYIRYNEIPKDEALYQFLLPLALSSKRGSRDNCIDCTNAIYRYMTFNLDEQSKKDAKCLSKPVTNNTKNNTKNNDKSNDKCDDNEDKKVTELKELLIGIKCKENSEKNKNVKNIKSRKMSFKSDTTDNEVLKACIKNKDFYYKTVKANLRLIIEVEKVFRKHLNKNVLMPSKEGDMNFLPLNQMNAYMDSFTMDEGNNYLNHKNVETQLDVIIFRDISYSTVKFKVKYAEALIVFIESLSRFKFINVAAIDFGSNSNITKYFENKVPGIVPFTSGTTNLAGALSLAKKEIQWKNKKRCIIILTDGDPDSRGDIFEELQEQYYKNVSIIPIIINSCLTLFKNDIHVEKINEIPKKLLEEVILL